MNKQCKACGSNVPGDVNFCQVCGGSDFWVNSSNQTQPKNKKTGLFIGIVAVVLLILAAIGMGNTNNSFEETPDKLYYSKGTFDGSVYTNKWADIKFALPEGFSNADLATYNAAENSNTECGVYFIADDALSIIFISYEKLPTIPVYDEEKYLDAVMKSLKSVTGITYKTPDTYSTATIGGYTYAKAECEFNNGNGDFSNTIYVRKIDNYMICISATGINPESNADLVKKITTVK